MMFTLIFTILSLIMSGLISYMGLQTGQLNIALASVCYMALGLFCLIEQWATRKTFKD